MELYCTACDRLSAPGYHSFCDCGGMIDVRYRLDRARLHPSANPYRRFADLLPLVASQDHLPQDAGYTPLIHAQRLGKRLGMPWLYLKDETALPTRSTKDRMAAVALGFLWERGVRAFCTSSTGNSSTAYAHAIRAFPEMRLYLFTAERFLPRVQHADSPQIEHFVLRGASFVEAFEYAGQYARDHGLISERGFFNPGRREGLKLSFLEAAEQIGRPIDYYVQAVSSAMGVYGVYKGAQELLAMGNLTRPPRVLCVQQVGCAPMVQAYQAGSDHIQTQHIVAHPEGIAEAILRGDPTKAYPYIHAIVRASRGDFVAVNEAEIRRARQLVEDLEGVSPCFSAAAAVAGVIQQVENGGLSQKSTVMINLTGGDRRDPPTLARVRWLERAGRAWLPA